MELDVALREFIISFCKKMKISNIDTKNINIDTSIDLDLNIFDVDMDLFLNDFANIFSVNMQDFEWGKNIIYPSDKNLLFLFFRSFFNYKKKWVKKICRKLYVPKVFVRDFQKAKNEKFLS